MDTLSSSVTTIQVPKQYNPKNNLNNNLKPTTKIFHNPKTTTTTSSISKTKPQKDNFTPIFSLYSQKAPLNFSPPRATVHRRASSGYAAALLDVAQCDGVVLAVARDVRRVLRVLGDGQFRNFVVEVVEKGKFEGHLVGLVKLLVVEKGKRVEFVQEVLEEFLRVFYQIAPSVSASASARHGARAT